MEKIRILKYKKKYLIIYLFLKYLYHRYYLLGRSESNFVFFFAYENI